MNLLKSNTSVANPDSAAVFATHDITKVYRMGEVSVHALRGVTMELFEGEFVVLLGPSGSGKSTLLNILGGLDVPSSGSVNFLDQNLTESTDWELTQFRRQHVGFVFQFYNLIPSLTARENVALVTEIAHDPMDPADALALVGLKERLDHFPAQMSGGEQQRVAIARAVAKRPSVLLCDEPTGALDAKTGVVVLEVIERVNRELGTTTAVITHNAVIADMADRVISLSDGRVVETRRNTQKRRGGWDCVVAMRALDRKLLRNLWEMKGQATAIALVIACGVAMSVMSLSTLRSLDATRQTYYERFRFAEVFASFKRGPLSLRQRVEELPGVARVEPRIVRSVNLIVEGLREPAVGRLISIPDHGQPRLNQLYLRRGRMPEPGRLEVVVGESFANAHGFQPGATVKAIMNGRLRTLRIVGIALSPEFIVEMNAADMLPDFKRFGVFWMPVTEMEAAFDMDGACDDISLTLMHGANEADVIRRLDNLLNDWGGVGSIGRKDQMSHRFISDEIDQLRAMGFVTPIIFMSVAAFLLNIVMTRVIDMQRAQIAGLKAFGYHNRELAAHYLKFVAMIVLVGVVLGTIFGVWMGHGLTQMYTRFFHFPMFQFVFDWQTTTLTALLCSFAAVAGTYRSLWLAVRLPPAEAMRPKSPGEFHPTFLDRFGLQRWLPQTWRMILRQIRRRPLKTAFSVFGIAMAAGVVVLGNYATDALDFIVDFQFRQAQRQDLWVNLYEASPSDAAFDMHHLPGVTRVETFRALPVRMHSGPRSRRMSIMGLESDREIYRIMDQAGTEPPLSDDGIVVSQKLAELMQVSVGDFVTVEVLDGKRPTVDVRIVGTVDDLSGTNAFALRPFVNRIAQEGSLISGAWLSVDPKHLDDLYVQLKATPRVVGVLANAASIQSFLDTVGENQTQMQSFVIGFAIVIAGGVVYNTARISLSERDRELATMRVLGFTKAEISVVLLGELALLTIIAIPIGLVMGYGMAWLSSRSIHTDLFRIPLVIYPSTYGRAAIIVLVAAVMSGFVVRRKLDQLDLFAVLKGQE